MKKILIISALSFAMTGAFATELGGAGHDGAGGGGGGGAGVAVSIVDANAQSAASATSQLTNSTSAFSAGGNAVGGGATATSAGGNATNGSINNTSGSSSAQVGAGAGAVSVQNNYKQAAANAYAPRASGPATSCRLFVGLGGTNTSGSLSGGIPIGNDQTCLSDKKLTYMDAVNDRFAGTFNKGDYLEAVCAIEGMDATEGCIAFKSSKAPVAQPALPAGYAN